MDPVEHFEEHSFHPADMTLGGLKNQELAIKKLLEEERRTLFSLLQRIPEIPPEPGHSEYLNYLEMQKQVETIKTSLRKRHDEWMGVLKNLNSLDR